MVVVSPADHSLAIADSRVTERGAPPTASHRSRFGLRFGLREYREFSVSEPGSGPLEQPHVPQTPDRPGIVWTRRYP